MRFESRSGWSGRHLLTCAGAFLLSWSAAVAAPADAGPATASLMVLWNEDDPTIAEFARAMRLATWV